MAGGDLGTYGTVLRVTPLTDGTHDSIRMTNPGTTFEAGVMPRCLTLGRRLRWSVGGLSIRCFKLECGGVCCKQDGPRGQWGSCKAVVSWAAARQPRPAGETGWPHPRATGGAGHKSGSESSDRYSYRSERGPGNTPEWRACCRSLRKVAFASNWFPERIREVIWQRSDNSRYGCI